MNIFRINEGTIFMAKSRVQFALEALLESVAWFCSVTRCSLEWMSEAEGGCSLLWKGVFRRVPCLGSIAIIAFSLNLTSKSRG